MNYERIPARPQGEPSDKKLKMIDNYVEEHIGNTPTKYASEEYLNCPPLDLAVGIQRLMTRDHKNLYGDFSSNTAFDSNYAHRVIDTYQTQMVNVPEDYGAIPNADIHAYFNVGVNRYYKFVRDEILASSEEQNIACSFLHIVERYIKTFNIPSWEAVRYTTRLIRKYLPNFAERSKQIVINRPIDKRLVTRKVFLEFLQSEDLNTHFEALLNEIDGESKFSQAFNYLVKENKSTNDPDNNGILEMYKDDFESLKTAYHLAERPYSKEELLAGQEILDTDQHLKAALVIFHYQLMNFIANYLTQHPERLAHSVEHLTEIFLTVEDGDGEIKLIPNPKLLKVISRNVMPAIARVYLEKSSSELNEEHIVAGANMAKNLLLFQTFIGEFHTSNDQDGNVHLSSFISQTCPAMQPFSKALVEELPNIYQNCKNNKITFEG
jgi:hypothetical protein